MDVHLDVGPKKTPSITSYLDEQSRAILKVFENGLYGVFNEDQKLALVAGYSSGLSTEHCAMKDAADLCRYWNRKQWTEEEMEEFQILSLSRPGMDGIAVAFEDHPMYKRIMLSESGNMVSEPYIHPIKPQISFYESEEDDDVYFNRDTKSAGSTGYRLHTTEVHDDESIKHLYIPERSKGVIAEYVTAFQTSNVPVLVEFDLLRSFQVSFKGVIRISCVIPMNKTGSVWTKDIPVEPKVYYNFSEKLLPNDRERCKVAISLRGIVGENSEITIMGILLSRGEKTKLSIKLAKGDFDPFDYGFRPVYKTQDIDPQ